MHPQRKQRLILVIAGVLLSSLVVGLIVFVMRQNIDAFYSPSKIAGGTVPINRSIRGGGCVQPGSVIRSKENLDVKFILTDGVAKVPVEFSGILPDLFSEGEAAVVTGMLDSTGTFKADQVLAKHDENYTPPEVAETLNESQKIVTENKKSAAATSGQHQIICKELHYGA